MNGDINDYEDLNVVISLQRDNEAYVRDMRLFAKEALDFVTKRDGQWETGIIARFRGRPRYTDDRVNPIINQMVGELYQADFAGRVRPAGDDATKDTARTLDGIIRTIRNKSHFDRVINRTGRHVAITGIGGWEIVKDYASPKSFDMDLMIQPIDDFHERVLIDPNSMSPVGEDAEWAIVKHYISKNAFAKKFGEDKKVSSLGHDNWSDTYYYKPENVTVGQLYYLKMVKKEIARMSNGAVYEVDDDYMAVLIELEAQGITEEARREVEDYVCCQRWYSSDEWLTDEEELDFNFIPVIPCYGNFDVTEGKVIFCGAVERLMDIQRVHNYAFTRLVENEALSPRDKWFMTEQQVAGHEAKIATLNTNMDPVQVYNHVTDQPPPFFSSTSSPNASLTNLIGMTDEGINRASGIFAANIGDNPGLQSGVAIKQQIDRGNNGTAWLFEALEMSVEYTCRLLLRAIPNTYDGTREMVITQDDGSLQPMTINEPVLDQETGEVVYLNDLTKGQYDVAIDIGAGYKNRQREAVEHFERLAAGDPAILNLGRDIHLNNIEAPNMDLIAERARAMMLQQGVIPEDQMTDEEKQAFQEAQAQAAQQPQQADPNMIALEIQNIQAQTAMMDQQNRAQANQIKMQELQIKYQGQQEKTQSDLQVNAAKIQQDQERIQLKALEMSAKEQAERFDQMLALQKQQTDKILAMADVMTKIKTATGADAIISPDAAAAYDLAAGHLASGVSE